MTASRILQGNNNNNNNQAANHHQLQCSNYDNTFRSFPFQQFNNNNNATAVANNNARVVFDNSYNQALPLAEYQFVPNEIIVSPTSIYKVLQFLGKGTFGQVVKCWRLTYAENNNNGSSMVSPVSGVPRLNRTEIVALKILKCHPSYERQAQTEAAVLGRLASEGIAGRFNVVQPHEFFRHKGHSCLVFEGLDMNLYEYLKVNQFKPVQLEHVRTIAQQVLVALAKLKSLRLIHADLKPENIMLIDSLQRPFKVKVIDFGSACFVNSIASTTYLQSRYYRAPEVILGLTYTEAIDMWSLGCVLAELFLGWPLYPGASEYDQIRYIIQTQGMPPNKLLKKAHKTRQFFEQVALGYSGGDPRVAAADVAMAVGAVPLNKQFRWSLKAPEVYESETGVKPKETRKYVMKSLKDLQMVGSVVPQDHNFLEMNSYKADKRCFISMLESILQMDPQIRMEPLDALNHPFITLNHLRDVGPSRLLSRSKAMLDSCHQLTPQDLDELSGVQGSPILTGVVDGLVTSTAPSMGVNLPSSVPYVHSGLYQPLPQVFIDYPQHLHHQPHMAYAYPPPAAHQGLPPHSSFHLAPFIFNNNTVPAPAPHESDYIVAPLITSNQQHHHHHQQDHHHHHHPQDHHHHHQQDHHHHHQQDHHHQQHKTDGRPSAFQQIPQVFDSLHGLVTSANEDTGGAFLQACAANHDTSQQHLNMQNANLSNTGFKRNKRDQKSKKKSNNSVRTRSTNQHQVQGHQVQGHPAGVLAPDWSIKPSCNLAQGHQPWWHARRFGSSNTRKQEFRNRGAGDFSMNNNNDNNQGNTHQHHHHHVNNTRSNPTPVSNGMPVICTENVDNSEEKVCMGLLDNLNCRKERVSQDSGIGRTTLPSPTHGGSLTSNSSGNVSSSDKDLSPEFCGNGLIDAMRNLGMPDDRAEPCHGNGSFERDKMHERNTAGETWVGHGKNMGRFEDPPGYDTTNDGRFVNYDLESMEILKKMTKNHPPLHLPPHHTPHLPPHLPPYNATTRIDVHPTEGPGIWNHHHHHHHLDQTTGSPAPLIMTNHVQSLNHPTIEYYPITYQQTRLPNSYVLHRPQLDRDLDRPPALIVCRPQQFQQPYHYNLQPDATMIPQHTHPASIILLSPEGSPSVYSLVAAPAYQASNCGPYALGRPAVDRADPYYNPRALQYIYQA